MKTILSFKGNGLTVTLINAVLFIAIFTFLFQSCQQEEINVPSEDIRNSVYTSENKITDDLADKYILEKENVTLCGKYWKLVTLNDKDVTKQINEPHIVFDSENKRVSGNNGCNKFSCNFDQPDLNRLKFGNIVSTKMACVGENIEDDFFSVLEQTTIYSLTSVELKLKNECDTTLAIFNSDYFK
jgi:heat shock protein HslJ